MSFQIVYAKYNLILLGLVCILLSRIVCSHKQKNAVGEKRLFL